METSADSEDMISQARRTRAQADQLISAVHEAVDAWQQGYEAWKRLMSEAREVQAESRNHRHIAVMRRALNRYATPTLRKV